MLRASPPRRVRFGASSFHSSAKLLGNRRPVRLRSPRTGRAHLTGSPREGRQRGNGHSAVTQRLGQLHWQLPAPPGRLRKLVLNGKTGAWLPVGRKSARKLPQSADAGTAPRVDRLHRVAHGQHRVPAAEKPRNIANWLKAVSWYSSSSTALYRTAPLADVRALAGDGGRQRGMSAKSTLSARAFAACSSAHHVRAVAPAPPRPPRRRCSVFDETRLALARKGRSSCSPVLGGGRGARPGPPGDRTAGCAGRAGRSGRLRAPSSSRPSAPS